MSLPTSFTERAKAAGWAVMPLALMVLGVKIFWPDVTPGVMLGGTISGLLTALVALGIAIVYRANRIVNFSAADLGETPAILALLLYSSQGWNIYLATATGLVGAVVLGVLVEFLFLRRFFRAPRLILTVATIGVTQVVVALGLLLPQWLGSGDTAGYPSFINLSFTVGNGLSSTVFTGDDVLVLIAVPLILLGLVAFFRFTSIGVALRASAEDADRASLLGIPVRRLQSVVWGLAALLAFAAMFMRIGVDGPTLGQVLDPALLLSALGAAVIGRMERLPTITLAAIGLGIVSQGARFHYASDAYRSLVIAAIIAIALLAQRASTLSRLSSSATSTWQETREIRAIPAELRRERAVRIARWALGALLVLGLVLIPVRAARQPGAARDGHRDLRAHRPLARRAHGWGGQVSLGQMAFVGWGAALAGAMAARWHVDSRPDPARCGAFGAVLMVVVGMPTLRARGLAFAVITLAFALATSDYLLNAGYSPFKKLPGTRPDRPHARARRDPDRHEHPVLRVHTGRAGPLTLGCARTAGEPHGPCDHRRARQRARQRGVRDPHADRAHAGVRDLRASSRASPARCSCCSSSCWSARRSHPTRACGSSRWSWSAGSARSRARSSARCSYTACSTSCPSEYAFLATGAGLLLVLLLVPGGLGAMFGDARDGLLRMYARHKGIRVPSLLADTRRPESHDHPTETFGESEARARWRRCRREHDRRHRHRHRHDGASASRRRSGSRSGASPSTCRARRAGSSTR